MAQYLAYAGIGSRRTPSHIQNIMYNVGAHLQTQGWVLRSGHAEGADMAFEQGADFAANEAGQHASKEIYLPWKGFNHSDSPFHPEKFPFTDQEMQFAESMHPNWKKCSPAARKLHARNVRQILGCEMVNGPVVTPVKFIICWTEHGLMKGGTAQAMRIAGVCEIPIFNLGRPTNAQQLEEMLLKINQVQLGFLNQKQEQKELAHV